METQENQASMKDETVRIYRVLQDAVAKVSREAGAPVTLPDVPDGTKTLESLGIDLEMMPDLQEELTLRFKGRKVYLGSCIDPTEFAFLTLDGLIRHLHVALGNAPSNPIVVYVDDEDENLFVFNRKFGRRLKLKLFTDPEEALRFIQSTSDVALVITDEVMPRLNGNDLCDRVQETHPQIPFILITGNPNQDEDLLYRSLRHARFFEFIQKPMDLDKKGEEYYKLFIKLIGKAASI
jgi:CheY-like chemotaxis protein